MSIKIITKSNIEPVSVAEAKLQTHMDYSDDDSLILGWIKTARELAETHLSRTITETTYEVTYDKIPKLPIRLPYPPLLYVMSVKIYDINDNEYTVNLSDWFIDTDSEPGRLCLRFGKTFPNYTLRDYSTMKIRYIAGYDYYSNTTTPEDGVNSVPEAIKTAILLYCGFMNEHRAMEGASGQLLVPLTAAVPIQFYHLLDSCGRVHYFDS